MRLTKKENDDSSLRSELIHLNILKDQENTSLCQFQVRLSYFEPLPFKP